MAHLSTIKTEVLKLIQIQDQTDRTLAIHTKRPRPKIREATAALHLNNKIKRYGKFWTTPERYKKQTK